MKNLYILIIGSIVFLALVSLFIRTASTIKEMVHTDQTFSEAWNRK